MRSIATWKNWQPETVITVHSAAGKSQILLLLISNNVMYCTVKLVSDCTLTPAIRSIYEVSDDELSTELYVLERALYVCRECLVLQMIQ